MRHEDITVRDMANKYIKIPILNDQYFVIFVSGKQNRVQKILKKFHYPDYDDPDVIGRFEKSQGITFLRDECHPVIAMPAPPLEPAEIATLAHEAVHGVGYIFEHIGERLDGEAFAHSIGAVVRTVLQQQAQQAGKK